MDEKQKSGKKHLVVAVILAVLAFVGNSYYLESQRLELAPKDFVRVVVSKGTIPAGQMLTTKNIESAQVPRNYAPRAVVYWNDRESILGQELAVDVRSGDYIMSSYFQLQSTVGSSLAEQVQGEGARAVTIPVDEINSLSRSVVSGDLIDISFTFTVPGSQHKMSIMLLQGVPVIATGSYSVVEQELGGKAGRSKRYNTLTLKLSVEDAMKLNYARQVGKINILLRNVKDNSQVEVRPISSLRDLLTASDREAIEALVAEVSANRAGSDEVREQLREALERQRQQSLANK